MRVTLSFDLPEALTTELETAAETSGVTMHRWAAQIIEGALAERRLDNVELGRCGPQIGGKGY